MSINALHPVKTIGAQLPSLHAPSWQDCNKLDKANNCVQYSVKYYSAISARFLLHVYSRPLCKYLTRAACTFSLVLQSHRTKVQQHISVMPVAFQHAVDEACMVQLCVVMHIDGAVSTSVHVLY